MILLEVEEATEPSVPLACVTAAWKCLVVLAQCQGLQCVLGLSHPPDPGTNRLTKSKFR